MMRELPFLSLTPMHRGHQSIIPMELPQPFAIERRLSPMHCASGAVIGMGELDHVMAETFAIEALALYLGNTGF
jgi:hypothetical protein